MHYTEQVLAWLADNPGFHAPVEVAQGTEANTSKAASILAHLTRQGKVKRKRSLTIRNGPGSSTYSI